MPTAIIPALLRPLCDGAPRLEVDGATLGDVLRALDTRCPGLYDRVVENGHLRPELAVAIDGEAGSFPLHEPLSPSSELTILPAISGGSLPRRSVPRRSRSGSCPHEIRPAPAPEPTQHRHRRPMIALHDRSVRRR